MTQPVLLFDGVCNLCNGLVVFFLNHEQNNELKFSPLQSDFSQNQLQKINHPEKGIDTIVLLVNDKVYYESAAVFKAAGFLKPPYRWIRMFSILPLFITDFVYKLIAKNRHHIFGARKVCMVPDEKWKERFII